MKDKTSKMARNRLIAILLVIFILLLVEFYYVEFFFTGPFHNQIDSYIKKIRSDVAQSQQPAPVMHAVADTNYVSQIGYEQAIINAVKEARASVVSIVISKNVPVYEQQFVDPFGGLGLPFGDMPGLNIQIPQNVQKGTKYQEIGAGSGFIVSEDGLILTNKHVVSDKNADYMVITNEGKKYKAKVLALDPVQDLAIIKIQEASAGSADAAGQISGIKFPAIKIGDSSGIQIGQGAITIGNALGQFSNTVSVGVISGLARNISASGAAGFSENLEGVIQTDAAINQGNSGGPLINLKGEVIGVNTAMADNAQSIGFAIPINIAKKDIDQIIKTNKIVYPFLGVHYIGVNDTVKQKYKLTVDYGALVSRGPGGEVAVTKDSAAAKAGIKEKDIILEINGKKITSANSMAQIIQTYNPGDTITLKILRAGKEMEVKVVLGERG